MENSKKKKIIIGAVAAALVLLLLIFGLGKLGKKENPMIVVEAQDNSVNQVRYDEKNPVTFSFIKEEDAVGEVTYELTGARDENGKNVDFFTLLSETNNRIQAKEGTPAGTYNLTIKVKAAGDDDYRSASKDIKYLFTVEKAESRMVPPMAILNLKYTGKAQTLVTAGKSEHGTILYRLDDGEWSEDLPSATEPGIYTVYYKLQGDENHKDIKEAFVLVSIDRTGGSSSAGYPSISYAGSTSIYDIINRGGSSVPVSTRRPVAVKPSSDVTVDYDGNVHTNGYVRPEGVIAVGETEGTDAGKYVAIYSPDLSHCWPDGTTTPVRVVLTINRVDPEAVFTKADLVYDGTAQKVLESAQVDGGTVFYSLDGIDYHTAVPEVRDAGEYTVYYRILGDRNHNDAEGSFTVTMARKTVEKPSTSSVFTYDGWIHRAKVDGFTESEMSYAPGSVHLASRAGTYEIRVVLDEPENTVWADGTDGEVVLEWTIDKAAGHVYRDPSGKDLTYNGQYQKLIEEARTDTGTMMYRRGEEGNYTEYIPTAKNAGTYRVYYYSQGDDNHLDTEEKYIDVTIKAADPVIDAYPEGVDIEYDGEPHELAVPGSSAHGHFEYRVGDGSWSAEVPTDRAVGVYEVFYRFVGDDNHADLEEDSVRSVIRNMDYAQYITRPAGAKGLVYTGESCELVIPGYTEDGTIEYRLGEDGEWSEAFPEAVTSGSYDVYYRIKGDARHLDTEEEVIEDIVIAPAKITVEAPDQAFVYNGEYQGDPITVYTVDDSEALVEYRRLVSYSEDVPVYRDVMTDLFGRVTYKRIYYRVSAENHETALGSYTIAILRRGYTVPTLADDQLVYDGTEKTPGLEGLNEEVMTVSGMDRAVNAGEYRIRIALRDTNNTEWADGTTAQKTLDWRIAPAPVAVPYLMPDAYGYDGTERAPSIEDLDEELVGARGDLSATDAGSYTISVYLKDNNHQWADGTIYEKDLTWTIEKELLEKPYIEDDMLVYDGTEQTPVLVGFDEETMTMSGMDSGVNAGDYRIRINITDPDNHEWTDHTTGTVVLDWTIAPASVETPSLEVVCFGYDGTEKTAVLEDLDETLVGVKGTLSATEAGEYEITVFLKDANHQWTDGTYADCTLSWSIERAEVAVPLPDETYFVYDTEEHGPKFEYVDESLMKVGGTDTAVEAGEYYASFDLIDKENYVWEDGTDERQIVYWTIARAALGIPELSEMELEYTGEVIGPELIGFDEETMELSGLLEGKIVQNYRARVELKDTANYEWEDGSADTKVLDWSIVPRKVLIPYLTETSFDYSGEEVVPVIADAEENFIYISGDFSATDAGEYVIHAELRDRISTAWADGTTSDIDLVWTIEKVPVELAVPEPVEGLRYTGEKQYLLTPGSADGGYISYSVDGRHWSDSLPIGTDDGTYSVYYRVNADSNHIGVEPVRLNVSIAPAFIKAEAPDQTYVYDGTVHGFGVDKVSTVNDQPYNVYYGRSEGACVSPAPPVMTDAGSQTVYFRITADHHETLRGSYELSVQKAPGAMETMPAAAEGLVYDGAFHSLLTNAAESSTGTVVYSLDGVNYTQNIPAAAGAGEYTVYCLSRGDDNHFDTEVLALPVTIARLPVEIPSVTDTEFLYDDTLHAPVITGYDEAHVSMDGTTESVLPGDFTITFSLKDEDNLSWSDGTTEPVTFEWRVMRLAPAFDALPSANELFYDGTEQVLVTDGATGDGTIVYSLDGENFVEASALTAKDAGQYTVFYKIKGDILHYDSDVFTLYPVINKGQAAVTVLPVARDLVYNGEYQTLVTPGETNFPDADIVYSLNGGAFVSELPEALDSGSYLVQYMVSDSENYFGTPVLDTLYVVIVRTENPVHAVAADAVAERKLTAQDLVTIDLTEFTGKPVTGALYTLYGIDGIEDITGLAGIDGTTLVLSNTLPAGEYTVRFTVMCEGDLNHFDTYIDTALKVRLTADGTQEPGPGDDDELPILLLSDDPVSEPSVPQTDAE